jgi:hypothetical protein
MSRTESVSCGQAAHGTISYPGALPRDPGLAGTIGQPCFSPHTIHGERFLGPNLKIYAADGGTRQKLRGCSVSPALSRISFRRPPSRLTQALRQPS